MDVPPEEPAGLFYTIYASFATVRLSQHDLLELLKNARIRNEVQGLTGMLLYRDGTYLQYLEGQPANVDGLLARLREDPRHKAIRILRAGRVSQRLFPDWSMAYKNLAGLRSAQVPGYSERLQAQYKNERTEDPAQFLIDMFQDLLIGAQDESLFSVPWSSSESKPRRSPRLNSGAPPPQSS